MTLGYAEGPPLPLRERVGERGNLLAIGNEGRFRE